MILQKKSRNIDVFILLCIFLIFIIIKYYFLCDLFSDCNLAQIEYGGDLGKYEIRYYASSISLSALKVADSSVLVILFFLFKDIIDFSNFLLIYLVTFYATVFFSAAKFFEEYSFSRFFIFLFIVLLFPFYQNYATHIPGQGLGIIFTFISILIVKRLYSFSSYFFIILSILSHYVFILVHLVFYISRFFSFKVLSYIFLVSIFIYSFNINDNWFLNIISNLKSYDLFFVPEKGFRKIYPETKIRFVLFTILPLIFPIFTQFKKILYENLLLKNLYKFHLLYSSAVYLLLSEYFYIDRFLSATWIFYPFYFLVMLRLVKL